MRLVKAIAVFFMPLCGGWAMAAPQMEYVIAGSSESVPGVPDGRRSWELRDSLGQYFNYRIIANDQAGFRRKYKDWMVHNLTADTHGGSLLLDWHPRGGRFRFSGGLFSFKQSLDYIIAPDINETFEFEVSLDPARVAQQLAQKLGDKGINVDVNDLKSYLPSDMAAQSISINRHVEFGAQDLIAYAQVKYDTLAPYVGLGWSSYFSSHKRLRYSFDIGLLYQTQPDLHLVVQGQALEGAEPAVRAWLDDWIIEEKHNLYDKLEDYSIAPRLGFGLSYSLN